MRINAFDSLVHSGCLLCLFFRGRSTSTLSKSVSVLDLSAKEKSAKPPRRLSIPAKSTVNSAPKSVGNITPISETRAKRLSITQRKSETPRSDISLSSSRKKFNVLSSASYWLNQIKYSESVAKHSISLGFFKLALEAGCEVCKFQYIISLFVNAISLHMFEFYSYICCSKNSISLYLTDPY